MAKSKKQFDRQLSFFDALKTFQEAPLPKPAGSFDIDRQFREAISAALKACPLSVYHVAARMSELVGQEITASMIYSWQADSKENHRFPAIFLPAFCEAVGSIVPLDVLGRLLGVFVLPGTDALRAEIRRLEEEIGRKQSERKRRLLFLRELEGSHEGGNH